MDKKILKKFKKLLLTRQQELHELDETADDSSKVVELDQTRVGRISRMDALQGQAMSQEVKRRRQTELQNITSALNKIERDDYGHCCECDDAIVLKRLELDPSISLCINCATKKDI